MQDRTLEEHQKLLKTILKKDKKRRKKLEAAGIEYECPVIVRVSGPLFPFFFWGGVGGRKRGLELPFG